MLDPARSRTGSSAAAIALLLLLAVAVAAVMLLGRGGGLRYRITLQNAGQLVVGDLVRIGGVQAGKIDAIELSRTDQAQLAIRLDPDRPRLHDGTTAVVRAQGLAGVASRYVDLSPGPNSAGVLDEGVTIPADRTESIVDLDQLFDSIDAPTRRGLQQLIDGSASWYEDAAPAANRSARYLHPALQQLGTLSAEVERDSPAFAQFVVEVGETTSILAARRRQLTELVGRGRRTTEALTADTATLGAGLRELPPTIREATATLASVQRAVPDLRRLVAATDRPSRELPSFLRALRPTVARAVPTFGRLRLTLDSPRGDADLLGALRALPLLATRTRRTASSTRRASRDGLPDLQFIRPYVPDLVSWLHGFGSTMGTYDAIGHYARTQPVFDAFDVVDDGRGGSLVEKLPRLRGRSAALSAGNLRRCPGAAGPTADGSGPFVDSGPDANADCDPTQTVGGDG